jgi:YbbR domain-containing protein
MISNPELVEVFVTMLPNPVYPLGGFVTEIGGVKISAQKKYEDDIVSTGRLEVVDVDGFFLAASFDVGEVASRLTTSSARSIVSVSVSARNTPWAPFELSRV